MAANEAFVQCANRNPSNAVILMGARSIILYIHLRTFSNGAAAMRDLCTAGRGALDVVRISGCFCRVCCKMTSHRMNHRNQVC